MPEVDAGRTRRAGQRPAGLLWAGVGLTPLAALILLLSGGGGVLFAMGVVLAMVAVALIGLSIALRPDTGKVRSEMEETLLEEIEMLREDLRHDISTAARATHHAFEERLQALQRGVDSLRAEADAARSAAGGVAAVPPVAQHPPVVATASAAAPVVPQPATGEVYSAAGADPHRPAAGRAHVPTGVVRHTETVHHVTTRSTFVDQHGGHDRDEEAPYGPAYHASRTVSAPPTPEWSPPRRRHTAPEEESWTDQMLRERYGRRPAGEDRAPGDSGGRRSGRRRRAEAEGSDGGAFTGAPDLDRWVSRRADERGEELRLGERRAAMRADGAGTEMRIEDRWAAVRREWDRDPEAGEQRGWEPGSGGGERRSWERDAGAGEQRSWERDAGAGEQRGWDRDSGGGKHDAGAHRPEQPALPAAPDLPSWNAEWEEPVREGRGRRHRTDDEGDYAPPRRRLNFELSDERWR